MYKSMQDQHANVLMTLAVSCNRTLGMRELPFSRVIQPCSEGLDCTTHRFRSESGGHGRDPNDRDCDVLGGERQDRILLVDLTFSAGLLDLAIDNTMERAKQRLGRNLLFSVTPSVTTFDFASALDRGLNETYDHIRDKAKSFVLNFAHNMESQRTGPEVWDGDLSIMKRVADIYNRQHKASRFNYELCEFEIEVHTLIGSADVVRYSARFETDKDPIYCHAIAVSDARHSTRINHVANDDEECCRPVQIAQI